MGDQLLYSRDFSDMTKRNLATPSCDIAAVEDYFNIGKHNNNFPGLGERK